MLCPLRGGNGGRWRHRRGAPRPSGAELALRPPGPALLSSLCLPLVLPSPTRATPSTPLTTMAVHMASYARQPAAERRGREARFAATLIRRVARAQRRTAAGARARRRAERAAARALRRTAAAARRAARCSAAQSLCTHATPTPPAVTPPPRASPAVTPPRRAYPAGPRAVGPSKPGSLWQTHRGGDVRSKDLLCSSRHRVPPAETERTDAARGCDVSNATSPKKSPTEYLR